MQKMHIEQDAPLTHKAVVVRDADDATLWLRRGLTPREATPTKAVAADYVESHVPSYPEQVLVAVIDGQAPRVVAEFAGERTEDGSFDFEIGTF